MVEDAMKSGETVEGRLTKDGLHQIDVGIPHYQAEPDYEAPSFEYMSMNIHSAACNLVCKYDIYVSTYQ